MKITELHGITIIEAEEGLFLTTTLPSEMKEKKLYLGINDSVDNYKEVSHVPEIIIPDDDLDLDQQEEQLNGYTLKEAYYLLKQDNEKLKEENELQNHMIDITMMATDEMFSLLEPMLSNVKSVSRKEVSPMVDMYVAMVQRGLKTIDQVPARYREQVKEILTQLEG